MYYVISDSEGSTLDTFRDESDAMHALVGMVSRQPADREELLLLAYRDDGAPLGAARLVDDVLREVREAALQRLRERVHELCPISGTRTASVRIVDRPTADREERPQRVLLATS